jgi:hypothetical protein
MRKRVRSIVVFCRFFLDADGLAVSVRRSATDNGTEADKGTVRDLGGLVLGVALGFEPGCRSQRFDFRSLGLWQAGKVRTFS